MKKKTHIFILMLMLVSCLVFVVSCEDPTSHVTDTQRVKLNNCSEIENHLSATQNVFNNNELQAVSLEQIDAQLVRQAQAWSDYKDQEVGDEVYRYTMTYLSPDIIEVVVLKLAKERNLTAEQYQSLRETAFSQLTQTDELSFLITAATSDPDDYRVVEIPVLQMRLVDTYGYQIRPKRWDRLFDNELNVSSSPQYGYVIFPSYDQLSDEHCYTTIDFARDTSITLVANNVKTGSYKEDYHWSIKLSPIGQQIAASLPTPESSAARQQALAGSNSVKNTVPTPSANQSPDGRYWLDLATFIFDVVVFLLAI